MTYSADNRRASRDARRIAGPPAEIYRLRPGESHARNHDPMGLAALGRAISIPSRGLLLSA
jgi:hypothetical protein